MTIHFVLILYFISGGGSAAGATYVPFRTEAACKSAIVELEKQRKPAVALCVPTYA